MSKNKTLFEVMRELENANKKEGLPERAKSYAMGVTSAVEQNNRHTRVRISPETYKVIFDLVYAAYYHGYSHAIGEERYDM